VCTDDEGLASVNPLYMSYLPGPGGHFNGHHGYGFKTPETFVDACVRLNAKEVTLAELDGILPTLKATIPTTAILEAGRRSLDQKGAAVTFSFAADGSINGFA
jgi:D-galacturonate reductase